MTSRTPAAVLLSLAFVALIAAQVVSRPLVHAQAPAGGAVDFVAHDIDTNFRGGYSGGRSPISTRTASRTSSPTRSAVPELAWYENPTLAAPRASRRRRRRSSTQAMADIDGDGIPEIAFQSSFAMQAANSAGHQLDRAPRRRPAAAVEGREDRRVPDRRITSALGRSRRRRQEGADQRAAHRRARASRRPTIRTRRRSSGTAPRDWKRARRHRPTFPASSTASRPVTWDAGKREQLLVASFEGIALYRASGSGDDMKFDEAAAHGRTRREGAAARHQRRRRRQAGRQTVLRLGRAVARQRGRDLHREGRQLEAPRDLRQGLERPRDRASSI